MNAGQLIMQTPVGATLPAPSTAASLPVGEKEASAFAGVLSGMTPQDSTPAQATGAAGMVKPQPAPVSAENGTDIPFQPVPKLDLLATIQAAVDNLEQALPPVAKGALEEEDDTEEELQADVPEPQDVALSAAGAMIAALQQIVGRMPETETEAAAGGDEVQAAAALLGCSAIGEQALAVPVASGERGDAKIDVKAEVKFKAKAEEKAEIKVEAKAEVKAELKPEVKADGKVDVAVIPVQSIVSGEQAAVVPAEKVEREVVKEAATVAQGSVVQRQAPSKAEAADSAPLSAAAEKGQVMPRPAEFRFPRSAAVEAALGNRQQVNGSAPEKTAHVPEGGTRMAVAQQVAEEAEAGFSGSDAGAENKGFEGFSQKTAELARPVMQNTAGVHQSFSLDASLSTSPQTLQSEKSLPAGSSEHIAAQVRDQLGSRELKPGSDQITIRLSPDHLGDIKVNFRLEDQHLKVEIVTENRFAKESLLQHADSLKESLARQNISMDKFEVTTGGGNSGNQGGNAQGEWRELARNRQSQQWLASGGYRTTTGNEIPQQPVYAARTEHAMLDLHF